MIWNILHLLPLWKDLFASGLALTSTPVRWDLQEMLPCDNAIRVFPGRQEPRRSCWCWSPCGSHLQKGSKRSRGTLGFDPQSDVFSQKEAGNIHSKVWPYWSSCGDHVPSCSEGQNCNCCAWILEAAVQHELIEDVGVSQSLKADNVIKRVLPHVSCVPSAGNLGKRKEKKRTSPKKLYSMYLWLCVFYFSEAFILEQHYSNKNSRCEVCPLNPAAASCRLGLGFHPLPFTSPASPLRPTGAPRGRREESEEPKERPRLSREAGRIEDLGEFGREP